MDITTQGEMPFPLERGMSLAPGYATMIGLRKVKTTIKQSTKKAPQTMKTLQPALTGGIAIQSR